MRVVTVKDNEGNKGKVTDTTKVTIYCQIYRRACKIRGGRNWTSARCEISIAGMVESWNSAGRSLRVAEFGRVVECSWTIVAGN